MGKQIIIEVEDTANVSDGHHTFGELYDHRIALFVALVRATGVHNANMSRLHEDGTSFEGWFILQLYLHRDPLAINLYGPEEAPTLFNQISYHLPEACWGALEDMGVRVSERALPWDGHSSDDVLDRLWAFAKGID